MHKKHRGERLENRRGSWKRKSGVDLKHKNWTRDSGLNKRHKGWTKETIARLETQRLDYNGCNLGTGAILETQKLDWRNSSWPGDRELGKRHSHWTRDTAAGMETQMID
ncbi:hypothetical protein PoB_005821300 [Plakobranchus ocellatus]|uniref:Uncharacterized protein n=1 Tax=Plakobranchus ocellatus TaxID=259542 RepID=A0AAV4CKS5_9GAST|nr:hypothetical protein PoB_005821300 [Plakobranchus ocellatus]